MPPSSRKFEIYAALDGQTLAAALKRLLTDASWNQVKRLVDKRHVQVNGNLVVDPARRLHKGDVVHVHDESRPPPVSERDIRIVHIDEHLVVIDKPAGVTTLRHQEEKTWDARRKQKQPTLDELLSRALPPAPPARGPHRPAGHPLKGNRDQRRALRPPPGSPSGNKSRPARIFPVHRLDRDTSGLMVFARTPAAEAALIRLFKAHDIERVYTAVVHGRVEPQTITSDLVRDRGDGLRGSVPEGQPVPDEAQHAVTHIRPLEHLGDKYTVAECRLETGRTHQIRIHLSENGHPLCGDRTYRRTRDGRTIPDTSGAPRQALHASVLGFTHPVSGKTLSFISPLPAELDKWLRHLKREGPRV